MAPHRLRRVALQRTRKRSQRGPQDFYHGLLVPAQKPRRDARPTEQTHSYGRRRILLLSQLATLFS